MFLLTGVIGGAAFIPGPKICPMAPDVPMPPANLLPAYIAFAAVEALAFGFAVAFAAFAWPAVRDLHLGPRWLNKMLFVTLVWFLGNWWLHDNLHMHVGLDMHRLIYVEYSFHGSLLACALILALSLMRLASYTEVRRDRPEVLPEPLSRLRAEPPRRLLEPGFDVQDGYGRK